MYDNMSYTDILQRMLDRVPDKYDKREGSVIYNALAPAAVEFQLMALELDYTRANCFADTAEREALIRRCAERGITPKAAIKARRKAQFNIDISPASRFSLGEYNWIAIERLSEGVFIMECETPGEIGNRESGRLIPIEYIEGLETAVLGELLIPGEDEEDTESLRSRYFAGFDSQAFGGNRADYKKKVNALDGVGGVKIQRAWDGGGTVKLTIIASDLSAPSDLLVNQVQTAVDPLESQGNGDGLAPIDHKVTVVGVLPQPVNISTQITFQEGWSLEDCLPYLERAVDGYFQELSSQWEESDGLIVRISQLETRLLSTQGVLDIAGTVLDETNGNLLIPVTHIPQRGKITNATTA